MTQYEVTFREDAIGHAKQPERIVTSREFKVFLWEGDVVIGSAVVNEYPALRVLENIEIRGEQPARIPATVLMNACRERWPAIEINPKLEDLRKEPKTEWKSWPCKTQRTLMLDLKEALNNPLAKELLQAACEVVEATDSDTETESVRKLTKLLKDIKL